MAKILSMDTLRHVDHVPAPVHFAPWRVSSVLRTLAQWRQRRRERVQLADLDARMLADLGLQRYDVEQEIRKPFWRA